VLLHRLAERAEDDPVLRQLALYVVATDTESNTASTATPSSRFCSLSEMPSFLYVSRIAGSTSSSESFLACCLGAE
jgi:hypothetical protein